MNSHVTHGQLPALPGHCYQCLQGSRRPQALPNTRHREVFYTRFYMDIFWAVCFDFTFLKCLEITKVYTWKKTRLFFLSNLSFWQDHVRSALYLDKNR